MTPPAIESEVKFLVKDLGEIRRRLEALGAKTLHGRILETNLRFDTPDGSLRTAHRALRLRKDSTATLTYKGPGEFNGGIRRRTELEIGIDDFESARRLLEALGYVVTFIYEKYRTTYALSGASVMLDELPYGDFVEIEGEADAIRAVATPLGLRWDKAIQPSYHRLFETARANLNLPFRDLTYDNFGTRRIQPSDLGVESADG